jgi:flagellar assembly factor FliW
MEIHSSRFGSLHIDSGDVLHFPAGLLGLEQCRDWVLLDDAQNDAVAWLQSVERPEVALAVVSPRRFVPNYRIRVARPEIAPLSLDDVRSAEVLVIVGRTDRTVTLNLKAPLLVNPARRLGRQVITNGNLPIRHELNPGQLALKRSA